MQKDDVIYRQAAIDLITGQPPEPHYPSWYAEQIRGLSSADPDVAEKLHRFKCCITDKKGFQHEVIYIDDIRRVTGWEI